MALAIFVFPTLCFSQGLKLDLLDGNDCRLYCDSTRQGLALGRDGVSWLPVGGFIRNYHDIDYENRFLTSRSYYFSDNEINENGHHRIFELSEAALSRSEFRGRADWSNSKKNSVGKDRVGGKGGKGLLDVDIPVKFPKVISSLVGEGGPGLSVTGNYRLLFKLDKNYTTGVARIAQAGQGTPGFQTQQEYNMFITGNVGSKLFVNMKTDKRANVYNQRLDLADRIQIRYKGNDEDLVQSIEAGNTNLSLGGTRFAGFSQSVQGLFGLKAQGKLGAMNWTAITSQQKGSSQSRSFRAGSDANKSWVRDRDFLRYTYFDLGRKRIAKPDSGNGVPAFTDEFELGRDSIIRLDLFRKLQTQFGSQPGTFGFCYVDPLDTSKYNPGEVEQGKFEWLINTDNHWYVLSPDSFYIRFNYPLTSTDVLGVYMEVKRANGQVDTIGGGMIYNGSDTTMTGDTVLVLKLIKGDEDTRQRVTYYYEWKNVYDLRGRDIEKEGFSVNIFKAPQGLEDNTSRIDYQERPAQEGGGSLKYIQLLGLDRSRNSSSAYDPTADNLVDLNGTVVDLARGHLVFPDRYPFNTHASFTGRPGDTLYEKVPSVYVTDSTRSTEYFLEISTKSRRTDFSLGQVNILEGSEDVRLNGRQMVRNVDYLIDYELGQIHFNNPAMTDPNADVQINYEYTPFLTSQKKNLFGLRAEYQPSEQLNLGTTVLYRNASTIDQKPRIGEEPSNALLLDANFAYTGQSNLITKLVDKLPGLTAIAPSAFQLDGEIARSQPNPNTTGRAFIDDFEGSRDFINLGIRRENWTLSSPPAARDTAGRSRLIWFTPDPNIKDVRTGLEATERFRVKEIFPERDVASLDERMDVLELRYFPRSDSAGPLPTSWAGFMRYLPTGLQNHVETQFLEFWVGVEEGKALPRLHFDLGKISEDINQDGSFQTEDKFPLNDLLSEEEDVGLNGLADSAEAARGFNADADNWGTDIDHINGTEKNGDDPGRLSTPDTEDLNGNDGLDNNNSYFAFDVDLNDTTRFGVPGSRHYNDYNLNKDNQPEPRPGEPRAIFWQQYRVPLKGAALYDSVGQPNWNSIQYVRVWMDSTADTSRLVFAALELVGNRWKVVGVLGDSASPVRPEERVEVAVINSQEHPNYLPPPGVGEVRNRVTNLFEREQSLVVKYENLYPRHQGIIQRALLGGAEDYSGYRTMRMWVHGGTSPSDSLLFFFRFSSAAQTDTNNFYEYRVFLKPGWDLANQVFIDFNRLTNLKNVLSKSPRPANTVQDTIDGGYRVRGNPSLAAVRWYAMGVENRDTLPATGEVWTDELMLTEVRRDPGTAGRFHLSTQLSDFGGANFEYSREGATFRRLTGSESGTLSYNRTAATNENISFSGSFQGHKLLPKFLGITGLPVSVNWSRGRSTPRLRTGSDIVLTTEFAEAERSEQLRRGFTVTPSLRRETKNWLWNSTFNRMGGSFSYSYQRSSDPFTRLAESRSYSASLSYDLSPKKTLGFKPFGWLPSFWLLKKIGKSNFSLLPSVLSFNGDVSRTQTTNIANDLQKTRTGSYVRDFRGRMNTSFRFFPNLTADYNFNTRRDISNPNSLVFSSNPRKFKLGLEVEQSQDFRTTYNPQVFPFADTRFNFSSNYRENLVFQSSSVGNRQIQAGNGYGASVSFNLSRFLGARPKAFSQDEQIRKIEEQRKKEAERKRKEEEKRRVSQPYLDSVRTTDSLARVRADSVEAAAFNTLPAETKFRQSVDRFVPLPVPGLGFVFPQLGPKPREPMTPSFKDTLSNRAPGDSIPRLVAGDTLARRGVPAASPLPDTAKKPAPGGGGIFLLSDGFDLLRGLAGRVEPIQLNYNRTNNITRQGLQDRPGLAFRFGLTDDPGQAGGSNASDGQRLSDNYTVGSGFDLGSGIRMGTRYAKNVARGKTTSGTSRQEAETFPDLTLTVSGLERRVGILKKILPSGSLSSNYQRQTATTFDVATGQKSAINTSKSYNPLLSISSTFTRGLSATFSYRKTIQTSQSRNQNAFTVTETKENGFTFSTRYSFIAPRGIRLPLLRGIRLSSSLNTNLSIQYSRRMTRDPNPASSVSGVSYDASNLSISPSMMYSFSTQVDGGLTIQWTNQKDHITKRTTKVRAATFSIDLKF